MDAYIYIYICVCTIYVYIYIDGGSNTEELETLMLPIVYSNKYATTCHLIQGVQKTSDFFTNYCTKQFLIIYFTS